jgi:uncharacterized Zn finger protein
MTPSKIQEMISDRMNEIRLPHCPEFEEFVSRLRSGQFVLLVVRCPCCGTVRKVQAIPLKPIDE